MTAPSHFSAASVSRIAALAASACVIASCATPPPLGPMVAPDTSPRLKAPALEFPHGAAPGDMAPLVGPPRPPRAPTASPWVAGEPVDLSSRQPPPTTPPNEPASPSPSQPAQTQPTTQTGSATAAGGFVQLFPHVRVNKASSTVEIDGVVPIDAHDPGAPNVYLELVACTPDTREHEALVMTSAQAAHVHAALLLVGATPGTPGRIIVPSRDDAKNAADQPRVRYVPPTGSVIDVRLRRAGPGGEPIESTPHAWIRSATTGENMPTDERHRWVFGGSRFVQRRGDDGRPIEVYDAQGAGTLISLATFGSDTLGLARAFSPESALDQPVWIADARAVPPMGSAVTIILRPTGQMIAPADGETAVAAPGQAPKAESPAEGIER